MYVILVYIHIVHPNINMYSTVYAIENGIDIDPPMGMHAEFDMWERIVDSSGRSGLKIQLVIKALRNCCLVNPNFWNFLYTKQRNLSTDINIVKAFDSEIEDIKMMPATLHITDVFH